MKPLKLVLTDHWFEEIKSGRKTHEYRNFTPYWENRLQKFEFSQGCFVQFQKAYRKKPERMAFKIDNIRLVGSVGATSIVFVINALRYLELKGLSYEQWRKQR